MLLQRPDRGQPVITPDPMPPGIARSRTRRRRSLWLPSACLLAQALSACAPLPSHINRQLLAAGEAPIQLGTPPRDNLTPMEASLACFAHALAATKRKPTVIGVGEIKDFTGRYSINEGNVVTQGGSLMLFSALGKMGGTVRIAERYDPSIAERELAYMDRRQLGNGQSQEVNGQRVPWLPYFGGTVQASDYYIVGGITEVNYNISSGGVEAALNNIGFKGRTYNQSVAIDLRIVDSRSLVVIDAISLSKQFTGYEVGANTFRFFGIGLVNLNLGSKGQEPLQLGIRATIEEAAVRLVARVSGIDPAPCLALRTSEIQPETSEKIFARMVKKGAARQQPAGTATQQRGAVQNAPPPPQAPAPVPAVPMPKTQAPVPAAAKDQSGKAQPGKTGAKPGVAPARPASPAPASPPQAAATAAGSLNRGSGATQAANFRIVFEQGSANVPASALAELDRAATLARQGEAVSLSLLSPETEKLDPGQRTRLIDQRIASLVVALASRGIPAAAIGITWRPQPTDSNTYRENSGVQMIAKLKLMR